MVFRIFFIWLLLGYTVNIYSINSNSISSIDWLLSPNVSTENEQYIRNIIREMKMVDRDVKLRAMSDGVEEFFGHRNAFVTYDDKSAFLFIGEEWFNTLTNPEKRALIGHELIHIEANHAEKKEKFSEKVFFATVFIACLSTTIIYLLNTWYLRKCERENDIEVAKRLNCARGSIELWQRRVDKEEKPELDSWYKIVLHKIKIPFSKIAYLFSTHPSHEERKAYLEELAELQEEL